MKKIMSFSLTAILLALIFIIPVSAQNGFYATEPSEFETYRNDDKSYSVQITAYIDPVVNGRAVYLTFANCETKETVNAHLTPENSYIDIINVPSPGYYELVNGHVAGDTTDPVLIEYTKFAHHGNAIMPITVVVGDRSAIKVPIKKGEYQEAYEEGEKPVYVNAPTTEAEPTTETTTEAPTANEALTNPYLENASDVWAKVPETTEENPEEAEASKNTLRNALIIGGGILLIAGLGAGIVIFRRKREEGSI